MTIATFGALAGLFIAVILILKKFQPVYGLILGALLGGLIGGANLTSTIDFMINGAKDISPSVLRVLSSGFLAACLIKTGAVNRISEEIVKILGDKHSILGIILSTFVLAAVGVNLDVAVITVAPIGLSLGKKLEYSKMAILLALLGGGKAGNRSYVFVNAGITERPIRIGASRSLSGKWGVRRIIPFRLLSSRP